MDLATLESLLSVVNPTTSDLFKLVQALAKVPLADLEALIPLPGPGPVRQAVHLGGRLHRQHHRRQGRPGRGRG